MWVIDVLEFAGKSIKGGWHLLQRLIPFLESKRYNYYYKNFNKKTYVDSNGNGVIVISQEIVVLDPLNTKECIVELDISDAKECCKFPGFKTMLNKKAKPFVDFKFAYDSPENIINEASEHYEHMLSPEEKRLKENKKYISVRLSFDQHRLEKNGVYHFTYMFSIPNMFPIRNGRLVEVKKKTPLTSSLVCYNRYRNVKCALYLSTLIELVGDIKTKLVKDCDGSEELIVVTKNKNILYNKYVVEFDHADRYRYFSFNWNVKG